MTDNIKVIVTNQGKCIEIIMIDEENNPVDFRPLEKNEHLVDVGRFNDFVKPFYDESTGDFIESATFEEIAAARPTPTPQLNKTEYLLDMEYRLSKLELGVK